MANDRAKPVGELVQLVMKPLRMDLVGQHLSLIPIFDGDKGVVEHLEADIISPELGRQFSVAVVIELKAERRPGGHEQMAKAQVGIYEVKIVVQALGLPGLEKGLMGLLVMPGFVCRTRIHGRKYMNPARLIISLFYDRPDTLFFSEVLFADEFDLKVVFLGQPFGIGTDFCSQRFGPPGIVENSGPMGIQAGGHSSRVAGAGDRPGDNHLGEARPVTAYFGGVTVDEKFHDSTALKQFEKPLIQFGNAA
ncbi:MAG: hypothetical protein KKB20_08680 [Proteobacteria bacterium]|nr:hypothetical protein [Pseudomonadota bacterium]